MKESLNIWQVVREYAGIAEAGGVKNVACSLAEGLVRAGQKVTVFMPFYGCTDISKISDFSPVPFISSAIPCGQKKYEVSYIQGFLEGVRIVFVKHPVFEEKQAVYTYTRTEEEQNPNHRRGNGHHDVNIINVVFQKAVVAFAQHTGEVPDVMQCQDAHTALVPAFAKASPKLSELFANTKFFVTIHNAGVGYHQQFHSLKEAYELTGLPMPMLFAGVVGQQVEPFLISAFYARLFTVSPWYAEEITNPEDTYSGELAKYFVNKNIQIIGITNGIDAFKYSPDDTAISLLPFAYNPSTGDLAGKYKCREWLLQRLAKGASLDVPELTRYGYIDAKPQNVYFSSHGRLAGQKGIEVLTNAAQIVLKKNPNACFIVLGQGEARLEDMQKELAQKYPGRYVYIHGYERMYARLCVAVGDFLLMPSFFEPCGLEDFIGQIYGTVPVAHAAGGLNKIVEGETGFLYKPNTPEVLAGKINELTEKMNADPDCLNQMIKHASNYVEKNYTWDSVIRQHYLPLYNN